MKLVVKLRLYPTEEQKAMLLATMREANACCNYLSEKAWADNGFKQYDIHHKCYYDACAKHNLSSQMVVRCISKTADAYKLNKKTKRAFRPLGSVAYDARLLSYKEDVVSLWAIKGDKGGRIKIPFFCFRPEYIPFFKGEADLCHSKGKFFLLQTVDVPEQEAEDAKDFLGCDFGLKDIVYMSDNTHVSADEIKRVKSKYAKVRKRVQSKGTRSCKRLLKRLSGREMRFTTITNHTISKQIVAKAKAEHKGIAIENLKHIRNGARKKKQADAETGETKPRKSKTMRSMINSWSFFQLRSFLAYKAKLAGVLLVAVNPAYTSQTCSCCGERGIRRGKRFRCPNCGNVMDADYNASRNIAARGGAVNHLEGNASQEASSKASESLAQR